MAESCEKIMPLLSAYMDGELSAEEARAVEEHIAECEYCRLTLESYRAINSDTLTCQPPKDFTQKVMAKVKAEPKEKTKKIIPFRYGTLAAAMAALVLLGASGTLDRFFTASNGSANSEIIVQNAAEEMETQLEEKARGIMTFSATFDAAPAEEAVLESAVEAPVAEPAPVMEEAPAAPAEPAAPAPKEAPAEAGSPTMVRATADVAEDAVAESEAVELISGTVTYVEPAEDGWYIKISDGDEIDVFIPDSVAADTEMIDGMDISLTVESSFDGYEYHYTALEMN